MALSLKLVCTILAAVIAYTHAFASTRLSGWVLSPYQKIGVESSLVATAKKKRRRRKNSELNKELKVTPEPPVTTEEEDFLPEFDLDDNPAFSSSPSLGDTPVSPAKTQSSIDMSDPKVLAAMKGTSKGRGLSSTSDLVLDRELEKRFQFDGSAVKDKSIPTNLANIAKNPKGEIGKKAARTEARRKAAIEAREAEEESESIFSKLSIGQKDGEFNYLKFVEQGTWVGIFALIAWEIYINTPLVGRVAPLAPVVYESAADLFLI